MSRKIRTALWTLAALFATTGAFADDYAFGFNPRSGDAWIDAQLGDVNVFARGNLDGYVDEVVVSTGAPRYYVQEMVVDRGWAPGDVYYACLIARQLGRPCADVVDAYEREMRGDGRGWGALAQELGIRPGSAEFHALKGGVGQGNGRMKGRSGGPPSRGQDSRGNGRGSNERGGNGKGNGNGNGRGNGRGG
ncbi:hypothetical protein [Silanimonas sp.]|jgi:hypothetical protein|uniref:hypothetical protein n=1 Tax=Silanimonas sp. TaxID=1929290 RepID=UPI0037C64122